MWQPASVPISFEKLQAEAPSLVKLARKAQFNLSKRGLDEHQAKVALCLDFSGSMRASRTSRGVWTGSRPDAGWAPPTTQLP